MTAQMIDAYGRSINYLRLSVTDRCNFRCAYCMAEDTTVLPRSSVLSLEELSRVCEVFVDKGVKRIRITGGEPLVRKGLMAFIANLGRRIGSNGGLDELTLTTNGSLLSKYAGDLFASGVRRVNISLDTLDPAKFRNVSRWGELRHVKGGIAEALAVGLKVKLNTVVQKGVNEAEIPEMIRWAHAQGIDLTLIELMPLGDNLAEVAARRLSLANYSATLRKQFTFEPISYKTGGPARYVRVQETGGRLGMVAAVSQCFCNSCNRVRLSCSGTLYPCLGHEGGVDMRPALRSSEGNHRLVAIIDQAIQRKQKSHDFNAADPLVRSMVGRAMNVTGG